jgi:hypothetical protein
MAFQHQHKRSSEKNRRPRPMDLIDGQLAVNYNPDTPGVYFKDSNGGIAKAGSVHIGSTPTPGNFTQFSIGELCYDPSTGLLQVWTGSSWDGIANSAYVAGVGAAGRSAYGVALDNGFVGTEAEWLTSLRPGISDVEGDIVSLATALGISQDDITFGTFTSSYLADNQNLKYVLEGIGNSISQRVTDVDYELGLRAPIDDAALTGTPVAPTADAATNTTQIATTEFVTTAVANLVGAAPATLDTLNEIAAAINDDAAAFATLTTNIAAVEADSDAAEAALSGRLDTLEADSTTATALAAVQADVDQNEADADAADTALSGRLDVLEADPTTAAAVALVQSDVNQNEADADAAIAELNTDVTDLNTAIGITENDQDLGTFAGSTLADNLTVKAALQSLETTLEAVDIDTDDLAALTGLAENVTNLGTFTGSTISDSVAVKVALQELETAQEATQADVDQNETDADAAIAAVQADVDQNETDADAAIAAVQADVDQNESDADAAIAAVQADVDANEAASIASLALKAPLASPALTGTPTSPTASQGTNTTQIATTAYVDTAIAGLIDSSPGALDTLNELAAAIGDDANFASTITASIAAVQTDVNTNEFNANVSIAAVQADVDANELSADNSIAELNTDVTDIVTTIGVAENAQNLGTFTGTIISDNTTVKAALQEVETALEGHVPVLVEAHNQTGGTLTKGDVVYVSGTHSSGKPTVALADANGSSTYPALGLIYATVANGAHCQVIISGFLDKIDTDTPSWNAGDALYLSETAGDLTTTRPTASGTKVQKVAMTSRRHHSAGSVIVIGAGRTNDVPNELTALTGVALNAANLGTFSGSTISDNEDVKTALQELETAHEALPRMLHASWDASTAGSFDDANDVIASRGIASVVRSATGIFRVTFTTAFANANYTVTCGVGSTDYSGTGASPREVSILERNAAYVDVICERSDDAVNEDNAYMSLIIML